MEAMNDDGALLGRGRFRAPERANLPLAEDAWARINDEARRAPRRPALRLVIN